MIFDGAKRLFTQITNEDCIIGRVKSGEAEAAIQKNLEKRQRFAPLHFLLIA